MTTHQIGTNALVLEGDVRDTLPVVGSVAPWFGSDRMICQAHARELDQCSHVSIPFAGGMGIVKYLTARTLNINDLHRHVVNLAAVMADRELGPKLYKRLRRHAFHPNELEHSQDYCRLIEQGNEAESLDWAEAYFICAWMPRHGSSGTDGEFNSGISTRWTASGGDSAAHYWGAVKSIAAWRRLLRRANFTTMDAFDFLAKCKDQADCGVYADAPFPGPGDAYTHKIDVDGQRRLATALGGFKSAKIVCRFYEHDLIREIYPESRWTWKPLSGGRDQHNQEKREVLIVSKGGG